MTALSAIPVETSYWPPGDDYLSRIVEAVRGKLRDGDVVVLSEKAISTALGNVIDESKVRPSLLSRLLARLWMRYVWGFPLGRLCRLSRTAVERCRSYPVEEGARHKEVCLRYAGFWQALKPFSEGGIDASNLPLSLCCLPLRDPRAVAEALHSRLAEASGRRVAVLIVDSDRTYLIGRSYRSTRPCRFRGVRAGGFLTYVIGRMLGAERSPTPIALAGEELELEEVLRIARLAERRRSRGAGSTVWSMARRFGTSLTGVTLEMLRRVKHTPIVIVRRK